MKIAGGFRGERVWIFLFYHFLNSSFAQTVRPPPDIRPGDENTQHTHCLAKDQDTTVGCDHFPKRFGAVVCAYHGGIEHHVCWRCDVNVPDNQVHFQTLCHSLYTTTTTTTPPPEPEEEDCKLWLLYLGWFVVIVCLIYDTFLLLFFVPGFPGYARMQCWMGRGRRPRERPKKRSAKKLEEGPSAVEIEVEVDNKTSSEVQSKRKSSKSSGRKKSKKGSGQKKSRKSQSVA